MNATLAIPSPLTKIPQPDHEAAESSPKEPAAKLAGSSGMVTLVPFSSASDRFDAIPPKSLINVDRSPLREKSKVAEQNRRRGDVFDEIFGGGNMQPAAAAVASIEGYEGLINEIAV